MSPQLLSKIAKVESSNGQNLIGDKGRARGIYQFHFKTWQDVVAMRKRRGLSSPAWFSGAMNEKWATVFAEEYANWIVHELLTSVGWVSEQSIYASWNVGVNKVIAVRGRLNLLNATTRDKCRQFDATAYR